jgi:hypothetical protein
MLLQNMTIPTSLMVTIWSLRSVPISLLVLMFVFNSGSISAPHANLQFWFDAIAISGIVAIIAYWSTLQRLRWNVGLVIYLYVFLVLLLRNPYKILTSIFEGRSNVVDPSMLLHSLWVGVGIFAIGMLLEVLIFQLRQFKIWAWWLALIISISYVSSIMFFFSGTLGIWSLLDPDTKSAFKHNARRFRV